jgi:hypothetical protein
MVKQHGQATWSSTITYKNNSEPAYVLNFHQLHTALFYLRVKPQAYHPREHKKPLLEGKGKSEGPYNEVKKAEYMVC